MKNTENLRGKLPFMREKNHGTVVHTSAFHYVKNLSVQ